MTASWIIQSSRDAADIAADAIERTPATHEFFKEIISFCNLLEAEIMNDYNPSVARRKALENSHTRIASDNDSTWTALVADNQAALVKVIGWPLYRQMIRNIERDYEDPARPFTVRQWSAMLRCCNQTVAARPLGKVFEADELAAIAITVAQSRL